MQVTSRSICLCHNIYSIEISFGLFVVCSVHNLGAKRGFLRKVK